MSLLLLGRRTLAQRVLASLRADGDALLLPVLSKLWSDPTGSTPAVQDGSVRAWLDSAKVVGPELVTGTITIAAGATGYTQGLYLANANLRVTAPTIAGVYIYDVNAGGWTPIGTKFVKATGANTQLAILNTTGAEVTLTTSQFSVREVGLLATEAISGYAPIVRQNPNLLNFDLVDDKLTISAAQLAAHTSATLLRGIRNVGTTTLSGQNLSSSGLVINQDGLVGLILCRVAPSAAKLALYQRYLDQLSEV